MSKRKSSSENQYRNKMNFFSSRSSTTPSATLIDFYTGEGTDHRKRKLGDILEWGVGRLEASHDYIQTLFPLPEESGVNWNAPVIDRHVFEEFRSRPELRESLRNSFKKMLWFYGFKLKEKDGKVRVTKDREHYEHNSENWDSRFDHNHLRITRIIRSLRVLGLEDEAHAFYAALEENNTKVSSRSREFWRRAAERDLNLRPDLEIDDEYDNTIGPEFLRKFEIERKAKNAKRAHEATGAESEEAGEEPATSSSSRSSSGKKTTVEEADEE